MLVVFFLHSFSTIFLTFRWTNYFQWLLQLGTILPQWLRFKEIRLERIYTKVIIRFISNIHHDTYLHTSGSIVGIRSSSNGEYISAPFYKLSVTFLPSFLSIYEMFAAIIMKGNIPQEFVVSPTTTPKQVSIQFFPGITNKSWPWTNFLLTTPDTFCKKKSISFIIRQLYPYKYMSRYIYTLINIIYLYFYSQSKGGQAATYHAQEGLFSIDPFIPYNNTLKVSRLPLKFNGEFPTYPLPSKSNRYLLSYSGCLAKGFS